LVRQNKMRRIPIGILFDPHGCTSNDTVVFSSQSTAAE